MKFKYKFGIILITGILLVGAVLGTIGFVLSKGVQSSSIQEIITLNSSLISDNISAWIHEKKSMITSVEMLITQEFSKFTDVEDHNILAHTKDSGVKSIYAISVNNEVRDSTGWRPKEGDDMTTRGYYQGAIKNDGIYYSDVYVDANTKENVVTLSLPIKDDSGKLWGVIATDSSMDHISKFMSGLNIHGGKGSAFILSTSDVVMFHSNPEYIGKKVEEIEGFRDEIAKIKQNIGRNLHMNYQGAKSVVYASTVPETEWVIGIVIPEREIYGAVRKMGIYFLVIVILIGAVGAGISVLLANNLGKNFSYISNYISKISSYELNYSPRKDFSGRKDEFGQIYNDVSSLQENFTEHISGLSDYNKNLNKASTSLDKIAAEANTTFEEILNFVNGLSESAANQAQNTERGVTQMSQLGESMQDNAKMVEEVISLSENMKTAIEDGIKIVEELIKYTSESMAAAAEINNVIIETERNSQKIGAASDVIAGIADQTNLLALNAAIEAARAGEAGKGFGVVAEEIRKLAEESARSTESINTILGQLRANSSFAVEKMAAVGEIVGMQNETVEQTKAKYSEIQAAVDNAYTQMQSVKSATQRMEQSKDSVIQLFESLAAESQANAANTMQTTHSAQTQASKMAELHGQSDVLQKMAEELSSEVQRFTL